LGSIPSFYFETRTGVQLQARRKWTREWWEVAKWSDALVTSPVVIAKLEETPAESPKPIRVTRNLDFAAA